MSDRTLWHRVPQSTQARRVERQGVLALIALPFLLVIGLAVGSVIGTWWHDKRKNRRRECVAGREL